MKDLLQFRLDYIPPNFEKAQKLLVSFFITSEIWVLLPRRKGLPLQAHLGLQRKTHRLQRRVIWHPRFSLRSRINYQTHVHSRAGRKLGRYLRFGRNGNYWNANERYQRVQLQNVTRLWRKTRQNVHSQRSRHHLVRLEGCVCFLGPSHCIKNQNLQIKHWQRNLEFLRQIASGVKVRRNSKESHIILVIDC